MGTLYHFFRDMPQRSLLQLHLLHLLRLQMWWKRKNREEEAPAANVVEEENQEQEGPAANMVEEKNQEQEEPAYDINRLPHDPGLRLSIASYHVNYQDAVRRLYVLRGPFKPHQFPKKKNWR